MKIYFQGLVIYFQALKIVLVGELACFIAAGEKEVLGELRVLGVLRVPGVLFKNPEHSA